MEPENEPVVWQLVKRVKETYPNKSIWLYTGYSWDDVCCDPVMNYVDVLVDGKFIEEQKNPKLRFRGSENQRIIDVQKSCVSNVVLWKDGEE